MTANRAILDLAAKLRENFLFNIFRMGKNSIEYGSSDHWTIDPSRIKAVEEAINKDKPKMTGSGRSQGYPPEYYHNILHNPDARDPRGYILPSDQADFLTAGKFVNTLIKNGITVLQATDSFKTGAKTYPQGSYIIKTAQAFRPHILDMLEPQYYPDKPSSAGVTPRPPYDSAGYTLAFQMGIEFDRILEGFNGPFEKIIGLVQPSPGRIHGLGKAGFLLSHKTNDSFTAVNHLLKSGEKVFWLQNPLKINNRLFSAGAIYIPAAASTATKVSKLAAELGLNFFAMDKKPTGAALALKPTRIGLWDRYGGSMSSGWIRWILENFDFNFEVVFPQTLDAGNLREQFDVLIFVSGAIPSKERSSSQPSWRRSSPDPETIPAEFRQMLGSVTAEKTIPQLHKFLKQGGTVLTIGSSTNLASHLELPLVDPLTEKDPDGKSTPLPSDKFLIPGSILQVRVNNTHPLAYGMPEKADVYFNRSPVFDLLPEASFEKISQVAWFDTDTPLRSGLGRGQHYLKGTAAVIAAEVGKGKLFLLGPEITFRAQPHGNFKFLFNGIYYGGAKLTEF